MDFIYHVGHLAIDRNIKNLNGSLTNEANKLHEKATRMLWLSDTGKAFLYQRRCMYGFEYHCRPITGA